MGKICLKCKYERKEVETAPDYECPSCGIIYAKYEAKIRNETNTNTDIGSISNTVSAIKGQHKNIFSKDKKGNRNPFANFLRDFFYLLSGVIFLAGVIIPLTGGDIALGIMMFFVAGMIALLCRASTQYVIMVECPVCQREIKGRRQAGDKFECPYCGKHLIICEGDLLYKR